MSAHKCEYQENSPKGKLLRPWRLACEADDEQQNATLKILDENKWTQQLVPQVCDKSSLETESLALVAEQTIFISLPGLGGGQIEDLDGGNGIYQYRQTGGKVTIPRYHISLGWFEEDCARNCERRRELGAFCAHIMMEVSIV